MRDAPPDGADFEIDCTGFAASPDAPGPLLSDLAALSGAGGVPEDGLPLDEAFAVVGLRQPAGAVYLSGAAATNGPVGPVDSFWGLQYAALAIGDDLALRGACSHLGMGRSVRGWWRWVRGRAA